MIRMAKHEEKKGRAVFLRQPARLAQAMRERERAGAAATALASLRLRVLRELERSGPRPVRELSRAWPVTRQHLRVAVRSLAEEGWVAFGPLRSGPRAVRLTASGRHALEVLDWEAAVRSAQGES